MNKHYDVTKINFSDLRNQKRELLKVIRERNQPDGEDELDGIVHLIDSIQDFVCDELGYPEMEVYDFADEDPDYQPEPLHETKPIVSVWLCQHCHSDNVEFKHWVNPNTNIVGGDCEEEMGYCNDCDLPSVLYTADLKASAKVIGFQVVSEQGDIHPDMDGSFCIYNLEQAQGMIEKGCNNPQQQWNLLTIWDGDVEEPTMMFEGDPRDTEMG